jgi:hypothetical protein
MPDPKKPDFLDAAIAAAAHEEKLVQVEMRQFNLKIMNRDDRPAVIVIPTDVTWQEVAALMVGMANCGEQVIAVQRPKLAIARALPNGPMS